MIQTLKSILTKILAGYGYRMVKAPKSAVVDKPEANLDIDLDFVVYHHLESIAERQFTIVQIGAFDGLDFEDPINKYLADPRFTALLVEPQPKIFARLQQTYAQNERVRLANLAVAHEDGEVTMYTFDTENSDLPGWLDGCASLDKEVALQYQSTFPNLATHLQPVPVPSRSMKSLLRQHAITDVDLLQIDVEGFDYEVIKMLDFQETKPAIINFERLHLSEEEREACYDLLISQGYKIAVGRQDALAYHA